jgi:hypothetical protein
VRLREHAQYETEIAAMVGKIERPSSLAGVVALLSCLITAVLAGAETDLPTGSRIDSICHPWSDSPCITRMRASLRGATSGSPLRGKKLRFVSGDMLICSSVTDASGSASCFGVAPSGRALAESGYRIVFDGDDRFTAESVPARVGVSSGSQTTMDEGL